MADFDLLRSSFNAVAELYDEIRPGYKEEVIHEILAFSRLPNAARILEVGCGTGQITIPFAERGFQIVALEPGDGMAAMVLRKCQQLPNVIVCQTKFEDWILEKSAFDLFVSAQAFHWIDPEFGCAKAAQALKTGGTMALVWHQDVSQNTSFYQATQAIYDRYLPGESMKGPSRSFLYERVLRQSSSYSGVLEIRHPWDKVYSRNDYLKLLNTFSDHRLLLEPFKTDFFQAIASVIDRFGGTVTRKHETQVLLARKI